MSRWDADSDRDYLDAGVRFTRPCERPGCDADVDCASPSVFCADCLTAAELRLLEQRHRELAELTERRRKSA